MTKLIKQPCSANWKQMAIKVDGRFCDHCEKEVKDLTGLSYDELVNFLVENSEKKLCGRVPKKYVSVNYQRLEVVIQNQLVIGRSNKLSFKTLMLLGVIALSYSSYGQEPKEGKTGNSQVIEPNDSLPKIEVNENDIPVDTLHEEILMGDVAIYDTTQVVLPEKLAEYPGGIDSLLIYLQQGLKMPKEINIQGLIIVRFSVSEKGEIHSPTIQKGLYKDLDQQVLDLIGNMPNWIPAQLHGKNVSSSYTLPVRIN